MISIITVNYNNVKGLAKTISSVTSQTTEDIEYIIIDGGSEDGSLEVINKFDSHISYWISEKDEGIYHAMNKGISKASGKYCLFLNSGDTFYEPNTLIKLCEKLIDLNDDIIYGDIFMDADHTPFIKKYHDYSLYMASYSPMPHQSTLISTKLIKELGGYDVDFKLLADRVFFIQAYINNAKFKHIDLCISKYDMTGVSSTNTALFADEEHRLRTEKFLFLAKEFEFYDDYSYYRNSRLFSFLKKVKKMYNYFTK